MAYGAALKAAASGDSGKKAESSGGGSKPPMRERMGSSPDDAAEKFSNEGAMRELAVALGVDPEKVDMGRARSALRKLMALEE